MMIFRFGDSGAFYTIHDKGCITVSVKPYTGKKFVSALELKDLNSLIASGHFKPCNLKADVYAKEIAVKQQNRHLALFVLSVAVAVGSIILGVWS